MGKDCIPAGNSCTVKGKFILLFIATIIFTMLINVFHPHLWGPDEPRVAEIARETYINGNYITPHLCGLPFVEKPPLYYDIVALFYTFNGAATPGSGRLVSALLGCIMLAACFWAAYRWGGPRRAIFSCLLLITMPQFYRGAHWIITDMGVGAFCTIALCIFLYYEWWGEKEKHRKWLLSLFYLTCAGAFLSKGLVGLFHIGIIIGAYILIRRRWDTLKSMLSPVCMLTFFIPVGVWIYLFYREGGIYFLHEHFINNTIGRFFHVQLSLKGKQLACSDIGNSSPWYFYLQRSPVMFGAAVALLPLILWDGLKKNKMLPKSWVIYSTDIKSENDNWKTKIYKFLLWLLNGSKQTNPKSQEKDIVVFLLLWSFLPVLILSFSSIKEVTYIIPSYVAIAILGATWLDERITLTDSLNKALILFSSIVIPISIASFIIAPASTIAYIITVSIWMGLCLLPVAVCTWKMRFTNATMVISAIVLCGIILGNTPEVMNKTGLSRKCHMNLAKYVFAKTGDKDFYVFGGCETIRSSMPFYGKRNVPVIKSSNKLKEILCAGRGSYVIIIAKCLKKILTDKELSQIIKHCKCEPVPFYKLSDDYILIAAPDKSIRK